jgi:hypothetical protein
MKTDNRLATRACVGPGKCRVNKARNRAAQHGPTEAERVATVLDIRFAHRGGMIVEQAAKRAQCHQTSIYGFAKGTYFNRRALDCGAAGLTPAPWRASTQGCRQITVPLRIV